MRTGISVSATDASVSALGGNTPVGLGWGGRGGWGVYGPPRTFVSDPYALIPRGTVVVYCVL